MLQNEISNVEYIVDKAYEKGMCIILNPSPFDEKMRCLDFNKISYLILNEGEAKSIHHFETLDEGIQFFNREYPELKIMLTLGENGCVYIDKENEMMQPAFEVKAVDTTGAGDTFTGYFVAGLAESKEYKDIIKIASAASAIAVSRNGAAPSIPIQLEVIDALGKLEEKKTIKKKLLCEQIESYIYHNLKTANLSELSDYLGYSTSHCSRMIKNLTGKTFSKLLQQKRCVYAAELLANTEKSIAEIVDDVGYENESFFRKIFNQKYGVNPLEYRKNRNGEYKGRRR